MRNAQTLAFGSLTLAVASVIGCGAGDFSSLFQDGTGGAGGAASTSSSSGSTSTSSGAGTTTTSSSGSSTTSSSSSSSTSTSSSSSSSSTTTSSSSSSSSSSSGIPCGSGLTCPLGGESACCWNNFGTAPPPGECVNAPPDTDGCKTFAATDGFETRIECALPAHCGDGQVCCANRQFTNNGSYYDNVACAAACAYPNVILCDGPAFPCPVVQTQNGPVQTTCKQSQLLPPGYLVCGT